MTLKYDRLKICCRPIYKVSRRFFPPKLLRKDRTHNYLWVDGSKPNFVEIFHQNPNFHPTSCRNCKSWKCLNWFHIFLEQQSPLKGAIFALFALFSLFVKSNSDSPGSDRQLCHPYQPTNERDQSNVTETVYLSG